MHARLWRRFQWPGYAVLALAITACSRALPVTTVVLVRHAERPSGADPELSTEGHARAESLAVSLARAEVNAIIHTQFRRTMQTAQPLAARKGITPIVLTATGPESLHTQAVVDRIRTLTGQTVVYVGHSNTVPGVIQRLGIAPAPTIAETEYGQLFIVTLKVGEPATMVRAKYGKQ